MEEVYQFFISKFSLLNIRQRQAIRLNIHLNDSKKHNLLSIVIILLKIIVNENSTID